MILLRDIISEANGNPSSMRVGFLACVAAAIFLAVWPVVHEQPASTELIITFLAAGMGGKVLQKRSEANASKE